MKWQSIFERSKVYGGVYNGDEPPQLFNIQVKDTWFQKRLEYIRQQQKTDLMDQPKKCSPHEYRLAALSGHRVKANP